MDKVIRIENLINFEKLLFKKLGLTDNDANIMASCLIEADSQGISSHGAIRIPAYARRIKEGLIDIKSKSKIIKDYPSTALIDAKNTLGQIVSEEAMNIAISKASKTGIGCVSVKGINHSGTCGHYSLMATKNKMIGISFVNTTPLVAVFGGTRKAVGNNPISIAIPADKHCPIVLDMACSVAQGKIEFLKKQGKNIPLGWAVDENGKDTTDACKALKGVLLPIAGPKGSGLAICIDILCGILSGAGVGDEVKHLNDNKPQNIGSLFIAIDISKFIDFKEFIKRTDKYIDYLKNTAREDEKIYMPGEINLMQAEGRESIAFPEAVISDLNDLASNLGIEERL